MDLRTRYLGLELKHPLIASAGPLSRTLDGIRRLEDGNAAAIVLFSLFEEQIRQEQAVVEQLTAEGTESFPEALSYFPALAEYAVGSDAYLNLIRTAAEAVSVPIIGSLNGVTNAGWIDYAREIEEAGAAALELNVFHIPTDLETTGAEVEQRYLDVLAAVKLAVRIPVAIKLNPYFSAFGSMAKRLALAGADGLVLFNRFYQPDIALDSLTVAPTLELSRANEIRLPLLWLALLHGRLDVSLAATSGVEHASEVIKYLLAGADVVMTTSALLRAGPQHMADLLRGLVRWLAEHDQPSVAAIRGTMSQARVADPTAFERANYIRILQSV